MELIEVLASNIRKAADLQEVKPGEKSDIAAAKLAVKVAFNDFASLLESEAKDCTERCEMSIEGIDHSSKHTCKLLFGHPD